MTNSNNPAVHALLVAIASFVAAIGGALAMLGFVKAGSVVIAISGVVVAVGTAAYVVYVAYQNFRRSQAVGVQAGIELATSGQAVDNQGDAISRFAPGATPPKNVTLASAPEIIAKFGPAQSEIKKA